MHNAIELIHNHFDKMGIKHTVDHVGDKCLIRTGMTGKAHTYQILFIHAGDAGNDVAVRTATIANFPREKFVSAYNLLNGFQQEYRFVKFVMDKDGDVCVQYDFPAAFEPIGKGAFEILLRLVQILDECYPKMMQEIWG